MNLIELGWKNWRVLAVCDNRGDCLVLEYLSELGSSNKKALKMLNRLRQHVPENGPEFRNKEKVKHLDDGIYEFRESPRTGPKPRVFFFRDERNIVVCTEAFAKRNERLDPFIERAKRVREAYNIAKQNKKIEIEKIPGDKE